MKNKSLIILVVMLLIVTSAIAQQVTEDERQLAADNNAFAFDLYHAVQEEADNIIFSPYSITQALAMLYLGADGDTAEQMADTLHYTLPDDTLHTTFNAMQQRLNNVRESEYVLNSKVNIANAIWGQDGYPFQADYMNQLDDYYAAELHVADFANAADDARIEINDWISEKTEERIQDMLQPGSVSPLTRLMLVNTIYFKAGWIYLFPEEGTSEATFTLLDGSEVTVDMMRHQYPRPLTYGTGEYYQFIQLDYQDQRMSMLVVLPDAGEFETVEAAFDVNDFQTALSNWEYSNVTVHMPRFDYETTLDLADTLAAMGMSDTFGANADFSGIADPAEANEPLMINKVLHRANITVDEKGTEAAAATVVGLGGGGGPQNEPIDFFMDRPFLFYIFDNASNSILFMGRVLDPGSES